MSDPHPDSPIPPSESAAAPVTPPPSVPPTTAAPLAYESVVPANVTAAWAKLSPFDQKFTGIGVGALLLLAVSTLFSWASISGGGGLLGEFHQSMAGTSTGWGKVVLLLGLAGVGAIAYATITNANVRLIRLLCAAIGSFAALFLLIFLFRIGHVAGSSASASSDETAAAVSMMASMGIKVSAGFGIYLGLLAGLAAAGTFSLLVAPTLASGQLTPADKAQLPMFLGAGAAVGLVAAFIAT